MLLNNLEVVLSVFSNKTKHSDRVGGGCMLSSSIRNKP